MITPDFSRAQWRKSSYSSSNGGACVEVAFATDAWRKSSYSGSNGGDCIEVAATSTVVGVRDSKNETGPLMAVPAASWQRFLTQQFLTQLG